MIEIVNFKATTLNKLLVFFFSPIIAPFFLVGKFMWKIKTFKIVIEYETEAKIA